MTFEVLVVWQKSHRLMLASDLNYGDMHAPTALLILARKLLVCVFAFYTLNADFLSSYKPRR